MAARVVFLLALIALLFASAAQAQDALQNPMTPADAVSKADTVFVGKITDIGPELRIETTTLNVTAKALRVFRGTVSSSIVLEIGTNGMMGSAGVMLHSGDSYIFFITKSSSWPDVFKLLPATSDNIAKVGKLIGR